MRIAKAVGLLALLAAGTAPATAASVRVTFADAGASLDSGPSARGAIAAHLKRLGEQYLDRGAQLDVTVLQLDRAGHDISSMGPNRLRLFNGSTPPKMRLRYRLSRNHRVVTSGEDYLSDQMYQSRPGATLSSDKFRYEKAMLDGWFREKFAASRR